MNFGEHPDTSLEVEVIVQVADATHNFKADPVQSHASP